MRLETFGPASGDSRPSLRATGLAGQGPFRRLNFYWSRWKVRRAGGNLTGMSTTSRSRAGPEVLRPWIEVARPAPEIADGTFLQGEFAANLQQVKDGHRPFGLRKPPRIFPAHPHNRRDAQPPGCRRPASVRQTAENPIIQTKTRLRRWQDPQPHCSVPPRDQLRSALGGRWRWWVRAGFQGSWAAILKDAGLHASQGLTAKVAVLHGGWLSPNSTRATPAGDPLNTLWGEMAWQLAGQAGYDTLGEAARSGRGAGRRGPGPPPEAGRPQRHPRR